MKWLDRALMVSPYYYGLCCTEKQFHRELRRMKIDRANWPPFLNTPQANATLHTWNNAEGKLMAIICIGDGHKHSIPQVHAMLVHEAVHLWQFIRQHIGEKAPSDEFEAYSVQTISQRLMEAYEEYSEKRAKKPNKQEKKKRTT